VTKNQQLRWYGEFDPNTLASATFDPEAPPWVAMNERAIEEISKRVESDDIICLTMGRCQEVIAQAFPNIRSVEWAVGYEGIFSPFCCFESYAWMHHRYAAMGLNDGRWYDTVIPNFFFTDQFKVCEHPEDYLLYVGRVTRRKGVHVAAELAQRVGKTLLVAGPGVTKSENGRIEADSGQYVIEGDHVRYIGILNPKDREEVMGHAAAVIMPTLYIEPFGAVAVEAMLSGTPAITTDWGAFTETVIDGETGFRFRTLAEGALAVEKAASLQRSTVQSITQSRYSTDVVGPQYARWFENLDGLRGVGWGA